ncbi:MAG: AMIN-like domain-containing (lipo)protein [Brooklawnia sp.]|jgi:hypothetical protein
MRARILLSAAAAVVLLASGCGGDDPEPAPGTTITSPDATTGSPATTAPQPTTTTPTSTEPAAQGPFADAPTSVQPADYGLDFQVAEVRVGAHEGYDRVVIEFTGGQAADLYWWAEYDANPRTQGKGDPVELSGEATLRVNLQGIAMPGAGEDVVRALQDNSAHGAVTGVYVDPMFEAMIQVFIGVEDRAGFCISTLESPARLVIDIENK